MPHITTYERIPEVSPEALVQALRIFTSLPGYSSQLETFAAENTF